MLTHTTFQQIITLSGLSFCAVIETLARAITDVMELAVSKHVLLNS